MQAVRMFPAGLPCGRQIACVLHARHRRSVADSAFVDGGVVAYEPP